MEFIYLVGGCGGGRRGEWLSLCIVNKPAGRRVLCFETNVEEISILVKRWKVHRMIGTLRGNSSHQQRHSASTPDGQFFL